MSHCYECLHGTPIWSPSGPYECPQSSILIHPVSPYGPGNSPASWGINIATQNMAPIIFLDHIIQIYNPNSAFNHKTYVNPNSVNNTCPNNDPGVYGGVGNIERVYLSLENINNTVYTVQNGCFDTQAALGTPAMLSYCYADVIDGLNTVNALFSWPQNFTTNMTYVELLQTMYDYSPGDRYGIISSLCGCNEGPCYCKVCTHWNSGYPGPDCIYSTINLQLCLDSAAATPCCVPTKSLKKVEFGECVQTLARHLITEDGKQIKTNKVNYESSLGNYSFGDCVFDPNEEKWKCCTFDGQSDVKDKTIGCRVVRDEFVDYYGIWRSCEQPPMLWDCVSSVSSCDNFKDTSPGYNGTFISMAQVEDYYDNLEPTLNIANTHFDLSLSPVNLSLEKNDYGWCMSEKHKYTYEPKYRILVTPINSTTKDGNDFIEIINQQIESYSFTGLINGIIQNYTGITINHTMKFSEIKSTVKQYINSSQTCIENNCSFKVIVGILPQPVKKEQVNCSCKQTIKGKYKTELDCLNSKDETKVAPHGFHYMEDGTLMSDAKHKKMYGSSKSSSPSSSSSSSSSGYLY